MRQIDPLRVPPPEGRVRIRVRLPTSVDADDTSRDGCLILAFSSVSSAIACADAILGAVASTAGGCSEPVRLPPVAELRGRDRQGVFRREGDYWTVAYEGVLARLRDAKGMRYLAFLLAHPGREFCALDLAVEVGARPRADIGPVLDAPARASYRRRLAELREELEAAEQLNDRGRGERARFEMEFVSRELTAAMGLRGRERRAGSDLERARVAVTLRIRDALARIERNLPALGRHLAACVETGRVCVYRDACPVRWLS